MYNSNKHNSILRNIFDLVKKLFIAIVIIGCIVCGILTYSSLAGIFPEKHDSKYMLILLNIDLFLLISILIIVVSRVFKMWNSRKKQGFNNKLHLRLVVLFAIVTATPTLFIASFSATFFNIGLQSWFSSQVQNAVGASLNVAESYAKEKRQELARDILSVNSDIMQNWDAISGKTKIINSLLAIKALEKDLDESLIFNKNGKVLAKTGYTLSLAFDEIPFWALSEANNGDVAIISNDSADRLRALMKIRVKDDLYLLIGKFVSKDILEHIEKARDSVKKYEALEEKRLEIEISFFAVFIIVALLLVLVAIWAGIIFSLKITSPIISLIDAAEQIRAGKTGVKVPEIEGDDEISVLNRTFNRMSQDIHNQRADLIMNNHELDVRRRFIEAVLGGVSAGVISVDHENKIKIVNQSACILLEINLNEHKHDNLRTLVPDFSLLYDEIKNTNISSLRKYIKVYTNKGFKNFTVNISSEYSNDNVYGFVYTFDDITPLETAQRKAAWSDVARRIAHEIKNPLTPISLSAERLRIKYLKQIDKDKEIFETCIETIIHQVENIGKMVDEFSAFSRMPLPVMKKVNIKSILSQSIFLHRNAHHSIKYNINIPDEDIILKCDESQIGHLLTNIFKNAIEAIEEKKQNDGEISISLINTEGNITIQVEDNGIGLKNQSIEQISEPYYTTKVKGTGLGLAIVKKIIEDHNGIFDIKTLDNKNTLVTIFIPL